MSQRSLSTRGSLVNAHVVSHFGLYVFWDCRQLYLESNRDLYNLDVLFRPPYLKVPARSFGINTWPAIQDVDGVVLTVEGVGSLKDMDIKD